MDWTSPLPTPALILGLLAVFTTAPPVQAQPAADSAGTDTTAVVPYLRTVRDAYGADNQSSSRLSEQFTALENNPLTLNAASASDLAALPGVSSGQAHQIVAHRDEHGAFTNVGELVEVDGVTSETVHSIRPFVTVDAAWPSRAFPSFRTIRDGLELDVTQRISRRLERSRGLRENRFLGSPSRLTTRIHLHHNRRIELGVTLDKDPGEPVRWSPATRTYGFDHVTGSLALRDLGVIERLVIGDFSAQFGQGVAMWQGIRFGKGRDPVGPVLRTGRGLLPYRSASEDGYFRGAGATFTLPGNVSATAFASSRHRDASPDSLITATGNADPSVVARTISTGGQHRTSSEIARKGTFGETTYGAAVEYRGPNVHVGATGYLAQFDLPLRPESRPYRQFRVAGRQAYMTSAYATAYLDDYLLFGEIARAANGAVGGVAGAAFDRGDAVQAILLGRFYPYDFPNFHGNSFGDRGHPQNESGFYMGLQLQVAENWNVGAYLDQFQAPWLQYSVPLPSTGSEGRIVLRYTPRPWLSSYFQGRVQLEDSGSEVSGPGGRTLDSVKQESRYSLRWHSEYAFSDALSLRTRIEIARHEGPASVADGLFLSQALRLNPFPSLQIDAKIAVFDTDDYAARIYAYERDLRYSFSVPVFFDQGWRSYLLVKYDVKPSLTVEAKYGVTRYAHRTTIGSGLNQIEGARRREIGLQLQWTL